MEFKSFVGGMVVGALLVSLIPYSIEKDEEIGAIEVRSLLLGLKKSPSKDGDGKTYYSFAIPSSGLDSEEE